MVLKVKYPSFWNICFSFLLLVLQAEESQKKRRAQECNDKGDPNFALNRQSRRQMWEFLTCAVPPLFISAVSSSPPSLLSSFLQCSSFARLWHFHPHPETCPAKSFGRSDRSHGPASTCSMCWLYWVCLSVQQHNWCVFIMQALHLIGQALLEEKTQLEDRTVEDVTFDFTLKARSKWKRYHLFM